MNRVKQKSRSNEFLADRSRPTAACSTIGYHNNSWASCYMLDESGNFLPFLSASFFYHIVTLSTINLSIVRIRCRTKQLFSESIVFMGLRTIQDQI